MLGDSAAEALQAPIVVVNSNEEMFLYIHVPVSSTNNIFLMIGKERKENIFYTTKEYKLGNHLLAF